MEAMKYSPYRIAMCLCQAGIVLSFFWIGPNNEYWFEEGVLYAILFTVTVVVLLDMPRGVVRWSVAGCYAVAFTAVFCRGWVVSHTAISPAWIMEAILMSFGGCMVVAVIVALVKWLAQLPDVVHPPYWWPRSLGSPSGDEHLQGSHPERRSDRPGV
jgi:peptidoglycan/LPS O-acetylase OafA/YrhL